MLKLDHRIALYMEGAFAEKTGKMGMGVLRFSQNEVVCLVDSQNAGADAAGLTGIPRSAPVVATVDEARTMGADVLVLGIAPPGGLIPGSWYPTLDRAIEIGFSLVNGLHDRLAPRYLRLAKGQFVWDVRTEPEGIGVGYGEARNLGNKRVLFIGTDMSVGKMTAGLVMWREALDRGVRAEFVATGQIGMVVTGRGVALDCVRVDFAAGAIEREVMAARDADLVLIEGQGSLVHPGSTSTLPLIRGCQPTHLVLCHRAGMESLPRLPWVRVPDLNKFVALYQDLAEVCGTYLRPAVAGVCLNCAHLGSDEEARAACEDTEERTGLLTTDPVRFGTSRLLAALLEE